MTDNLMCSGARAWQCWNSVGFNGPLAVTRLVETITAELYRLDGFDQQFRELVQEASQQGDAGPAERWAKLASREEALAREKENVLAAIAEYGPKPLFQPKISAIEAEEHALARERLEIEALRTRALELPESIAQLRSMLEERFRDLATSSTEFGDLMRQLVPEFRVYLVRLCDGGHPLSRVKVKLALAGIVPDVNKVSGLGELLTLERTLDLFEPPQRERIRESAVRLAAQGLDQRLIAQRLPENATQTAVQRALALDRRMRELGLESPYLLLTEPPKDYAKMCRYLNPRYQFQPIDGYERLPI
jgi:hypothetical protein